MNNGWRLAVENQKAGAARTALERSHVMGYIKFKKKKTRSDGNFRKLRFEKTSPRILKYQSTNVRKDRTKSLGIDTGTDEQQLITANPVSRAVLL